MENIYQIISFIFIITGVIIIGGVDRNNIKKKYLVYWALSAVVILLYIYIDSFNIIGKDYL